MLAEELAAADDDPERLAPALARYEARCRDRVETIRRLSRAVIERGQRAHPVACWLRNRRIRREGRDVMRMQDGLARLLAWPRPDGGA